MSVDLNDLAQRVQAMEDLAAITQTKVRYLRACDRKQPAEVRQCFTDDATIDFEGFPVFDNPEDFVALYTQFGCVPHVLDMHHMQNPVITLTGPDTATALFDLYFFQIDKQARTLIQLATAYEDTFRKVGGKWLLSSSKSRRLSFLMDEVSEDGVRKVVGLGEQTQAAFGQAAD